MTARRGHRSAPARRASAESSGGGMWSYLPILLLLLASAALGLTAVIARDPAIPEALVADRPIEVDADGYVSSDTCQACHPAEYESWYGSFHRTMTQVATPDTVRADFDNVQVETALGQPMALTHDGDEFWAEFDDPGWEGTPDERPRITRQVV
ncbi:MAG TPA: hypothetical protein EYQ83_12185, partial [Acidobacteria bacterium]|nr:hypothetical protein [Acidobacteriota bacterium]